jgi:hypothetical protein
VSPSTRLRAERQARWRRRARARLVAAFGSTCLLRFAEPCEGPLEFAHRSPALRPRSVRKARRPNGSDDCVRNVRANPFLFVLACAACHDLLDGDSARIGRWPRTAKPHAR